MSLKIALFVEGSPEDDGLRMLWELLAILAGASLDQVIGISKTTLVAMDAGRTQISGQAVPIDALMAQRYRLKPFDAAIVAWDLCPPWDREAATCRWNETLQLYRGLAASQVLQELPSPFATLAREKLADLQLRTAPGERPRLPCLKVGSILALCMAPVFEQILAEHENAVLRALGLKSKPRDWPRGWNKSTGQTVDNSLIGPAILAAQKQRTMPTRRVRGDFRRNKHGWARYLFEQLWADERAKEKIAENSIWRRWLEVTRPCDCAPRKPQLLP